MSDWIGVFLFVALVLLVASVLFVAFIYAVCGVLFGVVWITTAIEARRAKAEERAK